MPVLNQEKYCHAAIESVRAQTLRNLELIVVNDGSTDRTPRILEKLAARDPRIRLFNRPRHGIAASLNFGILVARAELLARADADDLCMPDRIARQVDFLEGQPKVAVLGGAMLAMTAKGRPVRHIAYQTDTSVLRGQVFRGNPVAHPAVMMRRSLVMKLGGYRRIVEYAEDYDLWLRISEHADLANLPDVLVHYRLHDGMTTSRHSRRQALHAAIAHLAACRRRQGKGDPLDGLLCIDRTAFDLLELDVADRARMVAMLLDARREDREHLSDQGDWGPMSPNA
jgi:glycosyltransferase involved in cell wall biosynthesis